MPHVSQEDGGFICGYIACMIFEELYCTRDGMSPSTDDKVEKVAFKVTNSSADEFKALTVQKKNVLKKYANLLVKADGNNELFSSRRQI